MLYYYPILESQTYIPQINRDTNLAFGVQFKKIISAYSSIGSFSALYNDLMNKGIPKNLQSNFLELARKLKETITRMPMKYIGRSINNDNYSIFDFDSVKNGRNSSGVDVEFLINNFGSFSIPGDHYEAFRFRKFHQWSRFNSFQVG